jgi:hypothetical protein
MGEVRRMTSAERGQLGQLVDDRSAVDALATYYALFHPAERVKLYAYFPGNAAPSGFLAIAQTGLDLFRPMAVPFIGQPQGMAALLRAGLESHRPVMIEMPVDQRQWIEDIVELSEVKVLELMRLDPGAYKAEINVLVVEDANPSGFPRFEVRSGEVVRAAAGVNWSGGRFAEVYLESDPEVSGRGHSRSALSAIVGRLLADHKLPLYRVDAEEAGAQAEAQWVGFRKTGERTMLAQAILRV